MKKFIELLENCIILCKKELTNRVKNIFGDGDIRELHNFIIPELEFLLAHAKNNHLVVNYGKHSQLVSFFIISDSNSWSHSNVSKSEMTSKLLELNEYYRKLVNRKLFMKRVKDYCIFEEETNYVERIASLKVMIENLFLEMGCVEYLIKDGKCYKKDNSYLKVDSFTLPDHIPVILLEWIGDKEMADCDVFADVDTYPLWLNDESILKIIETDIKKILGE
jgi:hypothetical protein